jgi:two-component system OmpR family sensor kinase
MASLRSRLLAALLAVTAVGLLLLGGLTYVGQRSFLLDRLDDQVRRAPPAAAGLLDDRGFSGPDRDDGRGRPPPGSAPGSGLPSGTYVERRDADGAVSESQVFAYEQDVTADPALPSGLPLGRPFTVDGENGDDKRYRVYAEADRRSPSGGVIVVAAPLTEVDATLSRLLALEALVIAGVLLALGFVGWAVVRVGLLPLDRIGHTAGAIAGGDLSHRVEATDPRTEVGRLGIAFNAMLDRLERAFGRQQESDDRLRRFLADASHELRTPLASIRGYAELFRVGAASSPDDVAKAMRRIEDEAARMGVLVEDLLLLARLDEIAEAPHTAVDLAALAADAVDDARATAPDRSIALSGPGAEPSSIVVLGDPHQLRQVLGNLLRNALVHTPAGTPIEVGLDADGSAARIAVRDFGPGLPPGDPAELFERFWRAEGGRERGKAGAGLGLAIVAAIVEAHGGRVEAADADGGGAVFTVVLPVARGGSSGVAARREGGSSETAAG